MTKNKSIVEMKEITYTRGHKYKVCSPFSVELKDCPKMPTSHINLKFPFVRIAKVMVGDKKKKKKAVYFLMLEKDFSWDGATCAIDTANFRRGSACHDALLEMIGRGLLPPDPWKKWADNFLIRLCEEDGMSWMRRQWVYSAVRLLGDPEGTKQRDVLCAP